MGLLKRASLVLGRSACLRQLAEDSARLAAAALRLAEKSSATTLEDFGRAAAGTDVGLELARLLYGDPAVDRFRAVRVAELEARVTASEAKPLPSGAPPAPGPVPASPAPKAAKPQAAPRAGRATQAPEARQARPAPDETNATAAAIAAGLRPGEVYRAILRGEIPARKPGPRCIRVSKAAVAKYAAAKAAKESA